MDTVKEVEAFIWEAITVAYARYEDAAEAGDHDKRQEQWGRVWAYATTLRACGNITRPQAIYRASELATERRAWLEALD